MSQGETIRSALATAIEGRDLSAEATEAALQAVFGGEATPAQIAGLLVALRMKGETVTEIASAARTMRRHAVAVEVPPSGPLVDTCGTGGDGSGSFNISTLAAVVVAACGVRVAKHGNRAASSRCGSADLLEALGVDIELSPARIAECIESVGIGFMFARAHHPAMRFAAPVRAELGVRTLFNFLGPLTNPAGASHQLLGVGDGSRQEMMAEVLRELGVGGWVVHGHGGLDEVSLSGPTRVVAVEAGGARIFEVTPADFGLNEAAPDAIAGGDAAQNAVIARAILVGEPGPCRDAVVLNAAATLCAAAVESSPASKKGTKSKMPRSNWA